jgi:[ribosomal protein S5]-alanine N-acetyltransferase
MDVVSSDRLDLILLEAPILSSLLAGSTSEAEEFLGVPLPEVWVREDQMLFSWRLQQVRSDPASGPWLLRAVILREPREFAGHFNFHAPPGPEGWVELGYSIEPHLRRKGYAFEVANRMMRWANEEHGVEKFRASVSPENAPSLAMISKLGFEQIGTQWDEIDGEEIVFMRSGLP